MRMLTTFTTPRTWPVRRVSADFMGDIFSDFDQVVDSFLQPTFARTVNFQPSAEVNETAEHYLVSFDMPGVKKDDIKIEVKDNQLHVWGERYRMTDGQQTTDKFERTFSLPSTINTEKIEAHYENGVLSVALPKAEAAKARTIEIQAGQTGFFSKLIGAKKEVKDAKES